jgi:hypothetical protein
MADHLIKHNFQEIVLFAGIIETKEFSYQLAVTGESGKNNGPMATVNCFLKEANGIEKPLEPNISEEVFLTKVRRVLWSVYKLISSKDVSDMEASIRRTFYY